MFHLSIKLLFKNLIISSTASGCWLINSVECPFSTTYSSDGITNVSRITRFDAVGEGVVFQLLRFLHGVEAEDFVQRQSVFTEIASQIHTDRVVAVRNECLPLRILWVQKCR